MYVTNKNLNFYQFKVTFAINRDQNPHFVRGAYELWEFKKES